MKKAMVLVAMAMVVVLLAGAAAWAQTGVMSSEDLALAQGALAGAGHPELKPMMGMFAITGPRKNKVLHLYVTAAGPDGLYQARVRVEGDPRNPRVTVEEVLKK